MDADANAKPVEREVMNFMFNAVTVALRQYQTAAFPEFITAADNGGSAFAYSAGTVVRYRAKTTDPFKNYVSLVDANTSTPGGNTTRWQEFIVGEASDTETLQGASGTKIITPRRLKKATDELENKVDEKFSEQVAPFVLPVGAIVLWSHPTPPDGWIELNGQAFNTKDNPDLHKLFPLGRVPDWRGRFIRAWDNGAGIDPDSGRALGSTQNDAFKRHNHTAPLERASDGLTAPQVIRGVYWPGSHTRITTNAGTSPDGGDETRPKNIAAMYIIKTDQSDEQETIEYPSAVVVTPSVNTIEAGNKVQYLGTILPASTAAGYAITWAVTDSSLGNISSTGVYSSIAGMSGEQTIIGSIQTDNGTITGTATVTQQIWLTAIELVAPDEMPEGDHVPAGLVFTPVNFSEPIQYSSSDSSIITFIDGQIEARGDGTATIAVVGVNSGVAASKTIKVLAGEHIDEFLRTENNLSEIERAGEKAQEISRKHLGLGNLATKDSLSSKDIGAVLLTSESIPSGYDLNDLTVPGEYFQNVSSNAETELNYPEGTACAIKVYRTGVSDGACRQEVRPYDSGAVYSRSGYGDPIVFSNWEVSGPDNLTADAIWEVLGVPKYTVTALQAGALSSNAAGAHRVDLIASSGGRISIQNGDVSVFAGTTITSSPIWAFNKTGVMTAGYVPAGQVIASRASQEFSLDSVREQADETLSEDEISELKQQWEKQKKQELMIMAEAKIAPLFRAVKYGMATEEEVLQLTAWERYTVLLNRVDCTNPEWPELP